MNNLTKWNFENSEVRTLTIENEPYFVGKDVAEILGYERPTKAVNDHVDPEDIDAVPIQDSIGRMQNTPIINESGLYSLILSSKLPTAKKFKRWVTSEVLPSIRRNGMYATDELIATSNAVPGCTGPIGLNAKIVVDNEVLKMKNFCCGANKEGYHYINANIKDFKYDVSADIVNVKEGDTCPNCGKKLVFKKGIEVGNTFKLGTKYSESLGLNYLGEDNQSHPVVMGSYGIGLERILSAIVEQNNDEKGIIWPMNVAPYKVAVVVINPKDEEQLKAGNELYNTLNSLGIDTLIDDRKERAGVKFNDMDLIGIPMRITVGKKITDGMVEFKMRNEENSEDCKLDSVIEKINSILNK